IRARVSFTLLGFTLLCLAWAIGRSIKFAIIALAGAIKRFTAAIPPHSERRPDFATTTGGRQSQCCFLFAGSEPISVESVFTNGFVIFEWPADRAMSRFEPKASIFESGMGGRLQFS